MRDYCTTSIHAPNLPPGQIKHRRITANLSNPYCCSWTLRCCCCCCAQWLLLLAAWTLLALPILAGNSAADQRAAQLLLNSANLAPVPANLSNPYCCCWTLQLLLLQLVVVAPLALSALPTPTTQLQISAGQLLLSNASLAHVLAKWTSSIPVA